MQYYNRNVLFCIYFKTIIDFIIISVIKMLMSILINEGKDNSLLYVYLNLKHLNFQRPVIIQCVEVLSGVH